MYLEVIQEIQKTVSKLMYDLLFGESVIWHYFYSVGIVEENGSEIPWNGHF